VLENPNRYQSEPDIEVYRLVLLMLRSDDATGYQATKNYLFAQAGQFAFGELQNIFNYLQNFCVSQINRGQEGYLSELFQLYQYQLEHGLLFDEGILHEWHYKNLVAVGIRLREMDWVRRFIEDYKSRLQPAIAENAYCFNLASYYFDQCQLDQVLELLTRVEYTDPNYQLESKVLLLRTYFDLEEYEALFSLTDSFRQLLQRNKLLSENRKLGYFNLLKFTKSLARIRSGMGFARDMKGLANLQKLRADFAATPNTFLSGWLRQKMDLTENEFSTRQ
jgi:hypothetical protein